MQAVVRNQLDGLILQDPSDELDVSELPDLPSVILTSNEVFSSLRNTVSTDTVGGVKKALTYLHSMGHDRIGIFWVARFPRSLIVNELTWIFIRILV